MAEPEKNDAETAKETSSTKANAAEKPAAPAKEATAREATPKKATASKTAPAKKAAATAQKKAAPARKKTAARKPTPKPAAKAPVAAIVEADDNQPSVTQLKEKIMATSNFDYTSQMTDSMNQAVGDMQARTQAAFDKSTEAMTEMTDFAKGNVEAFVETGKVFAESMQGMGQTMADEVKTVYETATADMKDMASIKSPTELFQLQGKIMRRNFDAMVAMSSKTTDATMKMANDVMAPLSARVNVAVEKMSKVEVA
ncbi:phasin family protein [Aurantiacibacter poecillastricola]|uniref:phasin family protein n=1 Tax=Aurantiacibacter poecillastricola TaxID=3064385 RepID=UPI00273E6E8E|nr:phasin family protein [Aurantiacibacter sp. 219JJ12-13]MDP5261174.1 phasin family protein [Aurantiacibacter sp. 219JJ12-13]